MIGFGNSDWSYDPFEKMVIFPPDPLIYLSFPEANDWTNIRDGSNNRLSIGQFSFKKKGSSSYTDANNACDVLAMFYLMSFLQMEDYHVTTIHSNVTDTAMMTVC